MEVRIRSSASRPHLRTAVMFVALIGLLAGCSFGPPNQSEGGSGPNLPRPTSTGGGDDDSNTPPSVISSVVAKNLDVPWAIAFLADGSALVTERDTGQIVQIGPEQDADGLVATPVETINDVVPGGEGGLLGIAV